jgi:enoyl-[acyl-carrier protein] reductase III
LGLATARELAKHGWGLLIVHRDRKSVLPPIQEAFAELAQLAPAFRAFNVDALRSDKRQVLVDEITAVLGTNHRIGLLVPQHCQGQPQTHGWRSGAPPPA